MNFALVVCAVRYFLRAADSTDIGLEQKRFYLRVKGKAIPLQTWTDP
jgi:hypothetical protein